MLYLLLVTLILALFLWQTVTIVRVRQGIVFLNRLDGHARRLVVGPRTILAWPFDRRLSLDLSLHTVRLEAPDAVTADLHLAGSLDVVYALDPARLRQADLDTVLPLLSHQRAIVLKLADYLLRALATSQTTADLVGNPDVRARVERQLQRMLQEKVGSLGLGVLTVRLTCRPDPAMLDAQLTAQRARLKAETDAHALQLLTAALGPGQDVSRVLPFELLQLLQQEGGANLLTTLNVPLPVSYRHATAAPA